MSLKFVDKGLQIRDCRLVKCVFAAAAASLVSASALAAPKPPTCSLSATPTSIGVGGSSTLTANCPTATSYKWSSNTGFSSTVAGGTVSPVATTTYSVAGINSRGTGAAATVTVTVTSTPAPPTCSLSASPNSIVVGGSSTLAATCPTATSYIWSSNTGFSSTVAGGTVSPAATTTYSVAGVNTGGTGAAATVNVTVTSTPPTTQRILWIGDSIVHGHYEPILSYNNANVTDVLGTNYGGIAGIFQKFASQMGMTLQTSVCLVSATPLSTLATTCSQWINTPGWQYVVLQEKTSVPLPGTSSSFCSSVNTLEANIHTADASTKVYLYENWPKDNISLADHTLMGYQYHNIFYSSAAKNGRIAGVAAVGDAWMRAWDQGVANPNTTAGALPMLWHGGSDFTHPSVYGAYLSALVHFQKITGMDVRNLGATETVAAAFGISPSDAVNFQRVAWETVTLENPAALGGTAAANSCP